MKHVHLSGLHAAITALEVIVVIGTLNLVAEKYAPTSKFWASYQNIVNAGINPSK